VLELLRKLGLPTVSASTQGPAIDNIISLVHWLMLILFVGWGIYFIYTLIRFRASKQPKADYQGVKNHYSTYAEVGVALIEVALLIGFAFPIWASRVNDVPNSLDSIQIRVVGQQFAWNIHYPGPDNIFGTTKVELVDEAENPIGLDRSDENAKDDVVTINQLHIPVNRPINVLLSTKDVIHNFKLPEFRVSQDAISGMEIPVWFKATMTTEEFLETAKGTAREGMGFEIACAQLCGLGHYRMKGYLTVHDDKGYGEWMDEQQEYLLEELSDDEDDWGDDDW
jgi:cytochrome c oxidase subunit 2|tara:strand:- start:3081 stop:3926 length:846 start_codon:yes stop_codon:yes gene_type:complete